jgi:hypothetical protein
MLQQRSAVQVGATRGMISVSNKIKGGMFIPQYSNLKMSYYNMHQTREKNCKKRGKVTKVRKIQFF